MRENYPNTVCEICGQVIANNVFKRHMDSHISGTYDARQKWRSLDHDDLNCKYCGKEYKNRKSLAQHEIRCKENPDKIPISGTLGHTGPRNLSEESRRRMGWSKGLTKETDERLAHLSQVLKGKPSNAPGRCYDEIAEKERRRKISEYAKAHGLGGYVPGSGKGVKGSYKGIWCDSSWELAYVIYNLDHNVHFRKNFEAFPYVYEGSDRNYTPDFYDYELDTYVEIKGLEFPIDLAKYTALDNLVVLHEDDMKPYLEYVRSTYGDDFIRLLEPENGAL